MSTFDDNFPAKGNPKMSDRVFGFDSESLKNAGMTNQALYDLFKGGIQGGLLPAFDLSNARVMTSIAPDGKLVKSNVLNPITNEYITFREVDEYLDNSLMNDSKVDGYFYIKVGDKYFGNSDFLSTRVINVKNLGANSNGIFDNQGVWQIIENILSLSESKVKLIFPEGIGYRSSRTLTIRRNVSVIMGCDIIYSGPASTPAITVGQAGSPANVGVELQLAVNRSAQSNWTDGSIGIVLINCENCTSIRIDNASRFTTGVRCVGDERGFVFNKIFLGKLWNNKIGFQGTNKSNGWFNENIIFGGGIYTFQDTNPNVVRTGILIDSLDGVYTGNNNNNFYEPSIELKSNNLTINPILIDVVHGEMNKFEDVREEAGVSSYIYTRNNSRANEFHLGYMRTIYQDPYLLLRDVGDLPSSIITARSTNILRSSPKKIVYNSGDLSKRCCEYETDRLYVENELIFTTSFNTGASNMSTDTSTHAVRRTNGIEVPSAIGLGVRVSTVNSKRFVVSYLYHSNPGRVFIRCYSSAGVQLSGISPRYVKGYRSGGNNPDSFADFGGSYGEANLSTDPIYFEVHQDVASIQVFIRGGDSPCTIQSFLIEAVNHGSSVINQNSRVGLYSIIKPTAVDYSASTIIYNNDPTKDVIGYILRNGTWVEFGGSSTIAKLTTPNFSLNTLTDGFYLYSVGANPFVNSPNDAESWFVQDVKGASHDVHIQIAWHRNNSGMMYSRLYAAGAWTAWVKVGGQAVPSANTATVASGATPTKAEFDALLTELRDLKTKMRTAGLLAS